jgi:hypothetical protein
MLIGLARRRCLRSLAAQNPANFEVQPHCNNPVCSAYLDMRDYRTILAHVHNTKGEGREAPGAYLKSATPTRSRCAD